MRKTVWLCLWVVLASSCSETNDDNSVIEDPRVRFSLDVQVVSQGFNGEWCWFHPRATRLGDENSIALLMQPWITNQSDFFQFLSEMRTSDKGQTWSEPVSLSDVLGEKWEDSVMVRICDVTPQWHQKSGTVLATGHSVRYINGSLLRNIMEPIYFHYSPNEEKWSSWEILQMPDLPEFERACFGCSQWVERENGDVLLPVYFLKDPTSSRYTSTVFHCKYDGDKLKYVEHGDFLDYERGVGLCEPSLIEFKGEYYLTLRSDSTGFVTKSKDGLHFDTIREWSFNDSTLVYSINTQQHWVKSPRALFLVYTSRREENKNVAKKRYRAPLFMAQFNEKEMVLMKETECILVPNNGAQLGNFGAFDLNEHESWVTTSEGMDNIAIAQGIADGRVYVVKINWEQ